MMAYLNSDSQYLIRLKRPLIKLARLRYSRGFGVHSPFAFELITQVINQRTPYYSYEQLKQVEKSLKQQKDKNWFYEPTRVKRLLFRLANEVKADTIFDVGTLAASSLYLKAARVSADYTAATSLDELFMESGQTIDFLYLHNYREPNQVEEIFQVCAPRATSRSLFVIEGIGYSNAMKQLWRRLQNDSRVGITFDLYDLGLLFFDTTRIKQDYIVNF